MTTKKIIVRSLNGKVRIEGVGFVGPICDERMEFMVRALGEELATELKPVYFETEEEHGHCYEPLCG